MFREIQGQDLINQGLDIARAYEHGVVKGWKGADLAKHHFHLIQPFLKTINPLVVRNAAGKKVFLHQATRKLLGQDTPNYPQEIGDCVSFASKNGAEYLSAADIIIRGDREKFRFHFPPWYYGASRVLIGGWDNDFGDGSLVSYASRAVVKYGCLFKDEPKVPSYSGSVAKQWGAKRSILNEFTSTTQKYLIKSTALISTWEEFVAAIVNGYPVTTGSGVGYSMKPSSDGFHRQTTSWSHAMCFIGVDDRENDPYALLLNSWGDVHGDIDDFDTKEQIPVGVLRVRKADVMKHIRERETFAWSQFDGFPETGLDKKLFKLIGT